MEHADDKDETCTVLRWEREGMILSTNERLASPLPHLQAHKDLHPLCAKWSTLLLPSSCTVPMDHQLWQLHPGEQRKWCPTPFSRVNLKTWFLLPVDTIYTLWHYSDYLRIIQSMLNMQIIQVDKVTSHANFAVQTATFTIWRFHVTSNR